MSATEAVYVYRDNARTAAPHGAWRYRHMIGDCILADEVLAAPVHATTREAIDAARRIYPDAAVIRAWEPRVGGAPVTPRIRGGQGRSAESIEADGLALLWIALAVAAVVLLAIAASAL